MIRFACICILSFFILACSTKKDENEIPDFSQMVRNPDNSLYALNQELEGDQDNPELLYKRAAVYYQLKKYENALDDINRSLERNSERASSHYLKALILKDQHKLTESLASARRAAEFKNVSIESKLLLCQLEMKMNLDSSANDHLMELEGIIPGNPKLQLLKGLSLLKAKDTAQAIPLISTFALQSAGEPEAYKVLCDYYFNRKIQDSAWVWVSRLQASQPGSAEGYYQQARLLRYYRLYAASIQSYLNANRADPYRIDAMKEMAGTYLYIGQREEALKWYKVIVAYETTSKEMFLQCAQLSQSLNQPNEALVYYKEAYKRDTLDKALLTKISYLEKWNQLPNQQDTLVRPQENKPKANDTLPKSN